MTTRPRFPSRIETFLWNCSRWHRMTFDAIADLARNLFGEAAPTVDQIATFVCIARRGDGWLRRFRRDRAVAELALEIARAGHTINQIRAALAQQFGEPRTPSRRALGSYLRAKLGSEWSQPVAFADRHPLLAEWIRMAAPTMTLTALHAACVKRVGAEHAPSRSALHRYLVAVGIRPLGRQSKIAVHPALAALIRERAGSCTLRELRRLAVKLLGEHDAPSVSAIHRYVMGLRRAGSGRRGGRVAADPEVAVWFLANHHGKTLDWRIAECTAQFGAARTPSRSALHRFLRTG
jgi:hypothetical protein